MASPVPRDDPRDDRAPDRDDEPAASRLLVVDDEPFVRDFLARCLRQEGYECDTAESADEAWSLLQEGDYQLLLSDIRMPGTDGVQLLRRARGRFGDQLAVVMVTAVDDKDVGLETMEAGAYSYLIKPFEANEAVIHVANALERRRLTLEANRFRDLLRQEVRKAQEEIGWRLLAAAGWRDEETGAHIHRVGRGAQVIASEIGWDPDRVALIKLAAAMHDIGKIGIPDSILLKPGSLTADEFDLVKRHTEMGASMLSGSTNAMLRMAEEIARSHHERWDGTGYPDGLMEENIPESARIVTVIDVYDALISDRPYRQAYSEEEALEIMRDERGRQFDPRIFDAFMSVLPDIRRIDEVLRFADDPSLRFPAARLNLRTQQALALLPELERALEPSG